MNIMYKCQLCKKTYEYYEEVYQNPSFDPMKKIRAKRKGEEYTEESGGIIKANGIMLKNFSDFRQDGAITEQYTGRELDIYINLCPDCMRKLLDNLDFSGTSPWEY